MLGLLAPTNAEWAPRAADEVDAVLVDHAHCEMKAASNALALLTRGIDHPRALRVLSEIGEEELSHLTRVLEVLEQRSVRLGPPVEDRYAVELLRRANASAKKRGPNDAFSDRLLVAALIEARSCERFKLLGAELRRRGDALGDLYEDLLASEARHHRVFVDLAEQVLGDASLARARLRELLEIEADIVRALPSGPTIHG
jgi:tRNA-(ms[2]io[6]A)-hydroxylase